MFFVVLKYLLSFIITNILYNFIYGVTNFARQHSNLILDSISDI